MHKVNAVLTLAVIGAVFGVTGVWAQGPDFTCEVMTVEGTASAILPDGTTRALQEGDVLKKGTSLKVGPSSSVNLAYDRQWRNVTRVDENTQISLENLHPVRLKMMEGDVVARLKKLPKNSTFEVQTPTAVASVRGSAYRTIFRDGQTQVHNLSESKVLVYTADREGKVSGEPAVLEDSYKTRVAEQATAPTAPEKMSEMEISKAKESTDGLVKEIQSLETQGRVSKIQSVEEMEAYDAKESSSDEKDKKDKKDRDDKKMGKGNGPDHDSSNQETSARPDTASGTMTNDSAAMNTSLSSPTDPNSMTTISPTLDPMTLVNSTTLPTTLSTTTTSTSMTSDPLATNTVRQDCLSDTYRREHPDQCK